MTKFLIMLAFVLTLSLGNNFVLYGQEEAGQASDTASTATVVDDTTLTSRVNDAFASDKTFSANGIQVETKDGIVTLTGSLPSDVEVDRAIQMAENVEGVKSVNSQLVVTPENRLTASAAPEDKEVRTDPTAGGNSPTPTNDIEVPIPKSQKN